MRLLRRTAKPESERKLEKEQAADRIYSTFSFSLAFDSWPAFYRQLMVCGFWKFLWTRKRKRRHWGTRESSFSLNFNSSVHRCLKCIFHVWSCKILNCQLRHNQMVISFQIQSGVVSLPASYLKTKDVVISEIIENKQAKKLVLSYTLTSVQGL